jgi:hypothetical protein
MGFPFKRTIGAHSQGRDRWQVLQLSILRKAVIFTWDGLGRFGRVPLFVKSAVLDSLSGDNACRASLYMSLICL